ncbi:hypothetical protein [Streptomyces enissocaesilis]|uniref:DUF4267 domain-containing protein n=1 Tax=Streptomyces enissocaesilis TaxID=332589 RepID=A0ABN3WQX0_9ACTN
MTRTRPAPTPRGLRPAPAGRLRTAARTAAVVSCVPYVALKAAWIAGSSVGIPDGSTLLDHPGLMAAANSVTLLMDATVVVLALALRRGRSLPLRTPPALAWTGSGVLGCWGGWLLVASALPVTDGAEQATARPLRVQVSRRAPRGELAPSGRSRLARLQSLRPYAGTWALRAEAPRMSWWRRR